MQTYKLTCWYCGAFFTSHHSQTFVCEKCYDELVTEMEPPADGFPTNTPTDEDTQPVEPLRFFMDADGVTHAMPPGPEEM